MRKLFITKQHPSIQHTHTHTYTHINATHPSQPKGLPSRLTITQWAAGRSIPDKARRLGQSKDVLTSHFISQTFRWLFVLHCTPSARAAVTHLCRAFTKPASPLLMTSLKHCSSECILTVFSCMAERTQAIDTVFGITIMLLNYYFISLCGVIYLFIYSIICIYMYNLSLSLI